MQHIEDFFEEKARSGDSGFAIALALLKLGKAQGDTAVALKYLGNGDASTPMGAIEALGAVHKDGFEMIANSICQLVPGD